MWYVMHVLTGTEFSVKKQCRNIISADLAEEFFVPLYKERYKGTDKIWRDRTKTMFPGYIFCETDHPDKLIMYLKHVVGMTRLLGIDGEIVPLTDTETEFLKKLGGKDHVVDVSEGIKEGSRIICSDGPLMGLESTIVKVDRHKRKACIEMEFLGQSRVIELGLEVIKKI